MKKQLHAGIPVVVLTAMLACLPGCGGGGGGDAPEANANTQGIGNSAVPEVTVPPVVAPVVPPVVVEAPPPPVLVRTAQQMASKIGANVVPPRYYTRSEEYVDLMQQSSGFGLLDGPWVDPATKGRGPINVGPDGWPTEDFSIMFMGGQEGNKFAPGRYTIVFKGTANVSLMASQGTLSTPRVDATKGVTVIDFDFPVGGGQMILAFKNTGGTVKDLRVIRNGYTWNDPNLPVFTTKYLQHLAPFSTLRFMDWTNTNTLYTARWATRPTLANTRAGNYPATPGKPWERVIELANAAKTDVWINVPTTADPEYYRELAKLFKEKLATNLKIYVEYSNEVWNGGMFQQYNWVATTGVEEEIALGNQNLKYDGTTDKYTLATRVFVDRTYRISETFRSVFGDGEMMSRVRPVLAWQVGGTNTIDGMIKYAQRNYPNRPASGYIYAISGAPYFSVGARQTAADLTSDEILSALDTSVQSLPRIFAYEYGAYVAKKNGVKWLAYEGGPDTFGDGSLAAKAAANRDIRMKALCQRVITDWQAAGGDLFMWFLAGAGSWETPYGTWPLEEYMDPSKPSPKSQCMAWASALTPTTAVTRHVIGVAFDAAETAGASYVVGSGNYNNNRFWYQQDQSRDYVVSAANAACYKLSVKANFSSDKARFDVAVNGSTVPTIQSAAIVPAVSGAASSSELGSVCLDAGVNVLSLKMVVVAGGYLEEVLLTPQ